MGLNRTRTMAIYRSVPAGLIQALTFATLAAIASTASAQELTDARRIEVARRLSESTVSVAVGRAGGSGFVTGPERWIVTNGHVVSGFRYAPIQIRFGDGTVQAGRVLAHDPGHDLAILEVAGQAPARPLPLGDSDALQVGQSVLAFGSPFGLSGTLTQGIVSARRTLPGIGGDQVRDLIQTDAQINPGNSGGPLANAAGEVVGVNTAILSRSGGSQGIGFAVPSSYVSGLLDQVRRELAERRRLAAQRAQDQQRQPTAQPRISAPQPGIATPVWLGIYGDDFRAGGLAGVRVRQVIRGGPAQRAGIVGMADPPPRFVTQLGIPWTGHIILAIDGHPVRGMADLGQVLAQARPGQRAVVTLTIGPGVVSGDAVVTLSAPPPQAPRPGPTQPRP